MGQVLRVVLAWFFWLVDTSISTQECRTQLCYKFLECVGLLVATLAFLFEAVQTCTVTCAVNRLMKGSREVFGFTVKLFKGGQLNQVI